MSLSRQKPRTCVACHEESPKRALVRVVRSPDGKALLDETGKLPGRGAYICAARECLLKAKKTGALSRALRVSLSEETYQELERCILFYAQNRSPAERLKELRSLLGLARRAGLLVIGRDHIQDEKRSLLVLTAEDASESVLDFARKMTGPREGPLHEHRTLPLSSEGISWALGTCNVQILGVSARSGLADKIKILLGEGGSALEQQDTNLRVGKKAQQEQ